MPTTEQSGRDVHDREKDLWSAINDFRDEGDGADEQRVQHFIDLFATAVEVAAITDYRAESGR